MALVGLMHHAIDDTTIFSPSGPPFTSCSTEYQDVVHSLDIEYSSACYDAGSDGSYSYTHFHKAMTETFSV